MAELAEEDAASAADQLVALDILRPAEHLEFAHPIVREAVRADIGRRELAIAHARGARILAQCGATEERIAARSSRPRRQATPGGSSSCGRVAREAIDRGAPAAAVAWLGRRAGGAAVALGQGGAADRARFCRAAPRCAGRRQSPHRGGRAESGPGTVDDRRSSVGRRADHLGARRNAPSRRSRRRSTTSDRTSGSWPCCSRERSGRTRCKPASTPAPGRRGGWSATPRDSTGRPRANAWCWPSLRQYARPGQRQRARRGRPSRGVLADGRFVGDQQTGIVGLGLSFDLSLGLIAADALDAADAYVEQMLESARAQAAIVSVAYLTGRRGLIALRRGAVAAAEADGRTALELLTLHNVSLGVPFALGLVVEALVEGGEPDAAAGELPRPRVRHGHPTGTDQQPSAGGTGPIARRAGQDPRRRRRPDRVRSPRRAVDDRQPAGLALALARRPDAGRDRATTNRPTGWRSTTSTGPAAGARPAASASPCGRLP